METSGCVPAEEVLCQAFSDVLLEVKDVDADDGADPNLCSEYVKDIYSYLRDLEVGMNNKEPYLLPFYFTLTLVCLPIFGVVAIWETRHLFLGLPSSTSKVQKSQHLLEASISLNLTKL